MKKTNRGFTLIEVVLVLAIGGLIFLLAFLAFSQVQRNRRDTQRRADLGRIVGEPQNYYQDNGKYPVGSSSNNGNVCTQNPAPEEFSQFIYGYLCENGTFQTPQGGNYIVNAPTTNSQVNRIR